MYNVKMQQKCERTLACGSKQTNKLLPTAENHSGGISMHTKAKHQNREHCPCVIFQSHCKSTILRLLNMYKKRTTKYVLIDLIIAMASVVVLDDGFVTSLFPIFLPLFLTESVLANSTPCPLFWNQFAGLQLVIGSSAILAIALWQYQQYWQYCSNCYNCIC